MSYIITTRHHGNPPMPVPRTRTAVATLDEAREHIEPIILAASPNHVWRLAESGGTIGPLPDGTVIEVRPCS